jgi:SHAQKYF class myb-like DNA-binding protein
MEKNQLKGKESLTSRKSDPIMRAPPMKRAFCANDPKDTTSMNASMDHSTANNYNRNPEEPRQSKRSRTSLYIQSERESEAWTEEMHRLFVESIYDMGVKHASPAVIIENMTEEHAALTAERVKSHLQKYRKSREKSKSDFLEEYESWMQKALTIGAAGGATSADMNMIMEMMGSDTLLGGDAAAFLSYTEMVEDQTSRDGEKSAQRTLTAPDMGRTKDITGARIAFPTLTEEERKSPLGVSISHVMGLFYSMTQNLIKERESTEPKKRMPETGKRYTEPVPQAEKVSEAPVAAPSAPQPLPLQHEPIDFLEDDQDLPFPRQFHALQSAPRDVYYSTSPPQEYDPTGMAIHYEPIAATHSHPHPHALAQHQQHEAYLQHSAFAPPSASFHLPGQMPHPQNFDWRHKQHGQHQESMHVMYPNPYRTSSLP